MRDEPRLDADNLLFESRGLSRRIDMRPAFDAQHIDLRQVDRQRLEILGTLAPILRQAHDDVARLAFRIDPVTGVEAGECGTDGLREHAG